MEDKASELLAALRAFERAVGDDAGKYINFAELFKNEQLMALLRASVERSIAEGHLPGFEFRDLRRFTWHLRYEEPYSWYFLNEKSHPSRLMTRWIRRFLLPNRFHYLAEVAWGLRVRASWGRGWPECPELPRHAIAWRQQFSEWLNIKDVDRGDYRPSLAPKNWQALYTRASSQTMQGWLAHAPEYRRLRQGATPYNGWHISSIYYDGGQLHNVDKVHDAIDPIDTGYAEFWEWTPPPHEHAAPKHQSLSFELPAAPDTWKAPDRFVRLRDAEKWHYRIVAGDEARRRMEKGNPGAGS